MASPTVAGGKGKPYIYNPSLRGRLSSRKLVIAIDGPAASGKSTTARLAAEKLGYLHVDTGAMYRAVTLKVLRAGIDPRDETAVSWLIGTTDIRLTKTGKTLRVSLDGEDVTEEIRSQEVTRAVSIVSTYRSVRTLMVREQRRLGADGGIVLEGRDVGTVVFPGADLKIFLIAGIEARARRRQEELAGGLPAPDLQKLMAELRERDRIDSTRVESPLRKAEDAIEVDTTDLTIDQQVSIIVEAARDIMKRRTGA